MTESIAEHVSMSADDNIIMFQKKAEGPVLMEQTFPKKNILYIGIKRIFDVAASCIGLVVLSPILLITAILIKAEDGGPVFFVQERVGKGEKKFRMYKFRSMRMDAAEIHEKMKEESGETEVSFKLKDDPRITKIGKLLRRTSIDELPQLINIIKGDMGIVGPRPLPTYEYEEERERYGMRYCERYQVQQGLTCYWQIDGRSEEMPFDERMQEDVRYARESNIRRDLCIIFRTFGVVISGKGAC